MNFKTWIKGLGVFVLSAFITSITVVNISPSTFNFSLAGLKHLGVLAAVIGVKTVLLYLKKSPLSVAGQIINKQALPGMILVFTGVLLIFASPTAQAQGTPVKTSVKKHALAKVARIAVKPFSATVGHPKRTLKQIAGSVLFAVETGVDGARLGLEGADKAFDAISIQGKVPVLDQIYSFVSVGAKDAAKLDRWIERQEQLLFGTHN